MPRKCPFYSGTCADDQCTLWKQYTYEYERMKDSCLFVAWLRERMQQQMPPQTVSGEA